MIDGEELLKNAVTINSKKLEHDGGEVVYVEDKEAVYAKVLEFMLKHSDDLQLDALDFICELMEIFKFDVRREVE